MKTILKRKCPICDGQTGAVLHTQRFHLPDGHPLSNGYDVVACDACGMVFADTLTTQKDYDNYYAALSKYEDDATSTGGGGTAWDLNRLRDTARYISMQLASPNASILDIGCGNGGLLMQFRELGYTNLAGIDPSKGCVRNMAQQGIKAHVGTLSSLPAELNKVDCIVLSHVLEHLYDVRSAIHACASRLNSDGFLYIEVPDASRYTECMVAPFQDFNTEHINHFSPSCLRNLLVRSGFSPLDLGQKTIKASAEFPYPATFVIGRVSSEVPKHLELDGNLKRTINEYTNASALSMQQIASNIDRISARHSNIYVWGTGQLLMKLLTETSLKTQKVLAFVDSNPINQGKRLSGVPIIPPNQIQNCAVPILIASLLHEKDIAQTITKNGLTNPILGLKTPSV